jgi:Ni2+-binding GTPase involved in maturation of urease and hydrogenase
MLKWKLKIYGLKKLKLRIEQWWEALAMEEIPLAVEIPMAKDQQMDHTKVKHPVPITLITGFLGSGKTTLVLNMLNNNSHGLKIAVLLNEFGDSAGIDKSLIKSKDSVFEEWLELDNGCLCCSVKENGVLAVEKILAQNPAFDAIL